MSTPARRPRASLRTTAPACTFEGSGATKVLVTGFQPFPADAWHENVAAVAVTSLDPASLQLPLDAIEAALVALGESPQRSRDPGRYICNNVMFADLGAMAGKRAGFIHLPYTTEFDDAARARLGKIAAAAIQAAVDAR